MINETMLPREGLFDRAVLVLQKIRHPSNLLKIDRYQLNQACNVELGDPPGIPSAVFNDCLKVH